MPLPTFSALVPAFLARREGAAIDQVAISLAVHPSLRAAHVRPGQFVKVVVPGATGAQHEGLFAMSNAPAEDTIEHDGVDDEGVPLGPTPTLRFLLRTNNPEGGEAAAALATQRIGAPVLVSEPAGVGFELARARGRHLAFLATGTAMAPVRAAIEQLLAEPVGAREVSLDLGVRSAAHVAYAQELARYRVAGLDVHVHFSEPREDGRVVGTLAHEALLSRLVDRGRVRDTFVVAVGQTAMVKELRARLVALGAEAGDIVSNH